jgi:hypothetical protein
VTTTIAVVRSRVRAALSRAQAGTVALGRAARPWLRPRHWTRQNLLALAEALRRRPARALALLAACGLLLGTLVLALSGSRADLLSAEVREGPFRVSILEAGTLQALRSVTYASSIQSNQAKIVALAPEGKLVQKGDLLVLFDPAPFEEEIRRSQALLAQAEAD